MKNHKVFRIIFIIHCWSKQFYRSLATLLFFLGPWMLIKLLATQNFPMMNFCMWIIYLELTHFIHYFHIFYHMCIVLVSCSYIMSPILSPCALLDHCPHIPISLYWDTKTFLVHQTEALLKSLFMTKVYSSQILFKFYSTRIDKE